MPPLTGAVAGRREAAAPALLRALRPLHWTKNLLVFVPAAMAHAFGDPGVAEASGLAFLSFCLCASGAYLLNDVRDAEHDRRHPVKRNRPVAAGALSRGAAGSVSALLLASGIGMALFLPDGYWAIAVGYVVATLAYSFGLKRLLLVDVLVLAGLYTLRIFAGGAATGIPLSPWLLAFSMFFFLGLALLKRYAELRTDGASEDGGLRGRGYRLADADVLRGAGMAAGYLSVLVLALYINSDAVVALYDDALALWLLGPVLVYWITRLWILAGRGEMHDDPIVFAATDPASWGVGGVAALLLLLAA